MTPTQQACTPVIKEYTAKHCTARGNYPGAEPQQPYTRAKGMSKTAVKESQRTQSTKRRGFELQPGAKADLRGERFHSG